MSFLIIVIVDVFASVRFLLRGIDYSLPSIVRGWAIHPCSHGRLHNCRGTCGGAGICNDEDSFQEHYRFCTLSGRGLPVDPHPCALPSATRPHGGKGGKVGPDIIAGFKVPTSPADCSKKKATKEDLLTWRRGMRLVRFASRQTWGSVLPGLVSAQQTEHGGAM